MSLLLLFSPGIWSLEITLFLLVLEESLGKLLPPGSAVCACGSEESPLPKIPERVGLAFPSLQKGLFPSPAVAIRDIWTPIG